MKTPLVLLPGLLSNETLWGHQIRYLSDLAEIHVISATENTPQKMVQRILEKAPSKFALAGHSMGGWLCLEIMRTAPERVLKLCLLNTTARSDSEEKKSNRKQMISETRKGNFPKVVDKLVDYLVFNPHVKDVVRKMFLEVGEEVFIHQEESMLARDECESILPKIKCPTLVIDAMEDQNFSEEEHKELADHIPGAQLARIADSGHMSPIEMPQAVTALMRLWQNPFFFGNG